MFLLVVCLLALLYTKHAAFAFLLVVIYLNLTRPWSRKAREGSPPSDSPLIRPLPPSVPPAEPTDRTEDDLHNLAVLRLELERLFAEGAIDHASCDRVLAGLDVALSGVLGELGTVRGEKCWKEGRAAAWELLVRQKLIQPGPPPWAHEERAGKEAPIEREGGDSAPELDLEAIADAISEAETARQVLSRAEAVTATATVKLETPASVAMPPISAQSAASLIKTPAVPPPTGGTSIRAANVKAGMTSVSPSLSAAGGKEDLRPFGLESDRSDSASYAWKPSAPSALERALRNVSGWPALIVPFLVQNIGWFIGGLCVVAGSVFLVSYTTGLVKSLTVSLVLFAYTLFILWAGYQLRRRRPELETSSSVLLSLGVLLVPLNIAASVRMVADGEHPAVLITSIFAAVAIFLGLYYSTMLVSAIMDRSLQKRHPQLFLALSATQIAVPILARFPSWPLMALFHLMLLGLLACGLVLFSRDWLHSIFVQKRRIAYYAAGTFVYAALVSFIHLTWGYSQPYALPVGYYSPFLMVLCGLLFYVDAQLKQWTNQYAFLSRITFAIYGLSLLALALSIDAVAARLVTLVLAIGLYGMVLWQYLTLPPLYLLLGCLSWLYGMLILQHLPDRWHLLASLPGLAALFGASRWLLRRSSDKPALICYRMWMGMAVALAVWSLLHDQPGFTAMGTALTLMVLFYQGLSFASGSLFGGRKETLSSVDLRNGPWLYAVTGMGCVAVAYAPRWAGLAWATQWGFGLVLLAVIWSALGVRFYRIAPRVNGARSEVLLNSALLNLGLCYVPIALLALPGITAERALPVLLGLMGGVALWLCLSLRERTLFYGVLVLWGAAGAIFKLTYFINPSTGAVAMLLTLAAWTLLWWLEREPEEIRTLRREQAALRLAQREPLTLLWRISAFSSRTYEEMLCRPLQQTMGLLWFVGMVQLGTSVVVSGRFGWIWTLSCAFGAVVSILAGGYNRLSWSIPLAVLLGLGAWLTGVFTIQTVTPGRLSLAAALYALLSWRLTGHVLTHRTLGPLARTLHLGGDRAAAEAYVHILAFATIVLSIGLSLAHYGLYRPDTLFFLVLATSTVFLWLAGQRYHRRFHSYALLGVSVLGGVLCYFRIFPNSSSIYSDSIQGLLNDQRLGLWMVLFALGLWVVAHGLDRLTDSGDEHVMDFEASLYRKPLRVVAAGLALCMSIRHLALVWTGPASPVSMLSIGVLLLAGMCLLLANHALRHFALDLAGILFAVLGALCVETALFHSGAAFTLWPDMGRGGDLWLTMSLLGFGLAVLAIQISRYSRWEELYFSPLKAAAALTCSWALVSSLSLFLLSPLQVDGFVSLALLVLLCSFFPLLETIPDADMIRGIAIPLLSCPLTVSALGIMGLSQWMNLAALLGGYVLWTLANFVLVRWNTRWPQWVIAPDIWPWLGVVAVSLSLTVSTLAWSEPFSALSSAGYLAACGVYLLLLLRNSGSPALPWLAALLLSYSVLTLSGVFMSLPPRSLTELILLPFASSLGSFLFNMMWANLFLRVVPLWRQHGKTLSTRWGWRSSEVAPPFLTWPLLLFSLWLLQLLFLEVHTLKILPLAYPVVQWSSPALAGFLLTLSFLHVWWLHRTPWEGHALLLSLFCTFLAGLHGNGLHPLHLPLLLALWSGALLSVHSIWEANRWGGETTRTLRYSLSLWLVPSLIAAMAALVSVPGVSLGERLATLTVLTAVTAALGLQRHRQHGWLVGAMIMLIALLHGWPLLLVPLHRAPLLSPWYALQSAVFVWLLLWSKDRLQLHLEKSRERAEGPIAVREVVLGQIVLLFSRTWPVVALLAVGEWALNGFSLFQSLSVNTQPQQLAGRGDAAAALLAALLLLLVGLRQARKAPEQQAAWVYGLTAFGGAIGVYIRLLLVGLAPPSVWDTAALMGATYVLFTIQQLTGCKPLLRVVLVMPLFALLTVPIQPASPFAAVTLVTSGLLYLLVYRVADRPLPLYLGLLAFNGAVYLWVPGWATSVNMFQLYVIPAAISVLLLLHLHRKELKPSVLNSGRLSAMSVLYASATLDVFLRGELAVFALVLLLSLAGIIFGIALRTRAFLYSGVAFLVLNILSQVVLLFPEQRLGKAILLLVLGVLITGGMIWFNIQREKILQRIRIFRADLETWV